MSVDVQCMRAGTAANATRRQRPERPHCTDEAFMQAIHTSMSNRVRGAIVRITVHINRWKRVAEPARVSKTGRGVQACASVALAVESGIRPTN